MADKLSYEDGKHIRQEGKDAFDAGFSRDDNPYFMKAFRDAWFEGYDQAQKEAEQFNH